MLKRVHFRSKGKAHGYQVTQHAGARKLPVTTATGNTFPKGRPGAYTALHRRRPRIRPFLRIHTFGCAHIPSSRGGLCTNAVPFFTLLRTQRDTASSRQRPQHNAPGSTRPLLLLSPSQTGAPNACRLRKSGPGNDLSLSRARISLVSPIAFHRKGSPIHIAFDRFSLPTGLGSPILIARLGRSNAEASR